MKTRTTQDARREFAALLEDVLRGHHIEITRYKRSLAVVVPAEWYETAKASIDAFSAGRGGVMKRRSPLAVTGLMVAVPTGAPAGPAVTTRPPDPS